MPELSIFKNECSGVFGLNGDDENSATYALGWVLSKSPFFLKNFILSCIGRSANIDLEKVTIDLQKSGKDRGYTDLEIRQQGAFHIIVEAKKLWLLPSTKQLSKYAARFAQHSLHATKEKQVLVTLSAASREYAIRRQSNEVSGCPVVHYSWGDLTKMIRKSRGETSKLEEKLWLKELLTHLKGYITMTSPNDNRAFCVVLSKKEIITGAGYTWVDVIKQDSSYFHPVGGNGWPSSPPNYIAFRKDGKLMSVHHIDSYQVVDDLNSINENWPVTNDDHFVYKLGPAMSPAKPLLNGKVYNSGRIWCAVDTLISGAFDTISAARDETKRRMA